MAVKPKDLAWEQELLQRRLEFVRQLKATLEDPGSVAAAGPPGPGAGRAATSP